MKNYKIYLLATVASVASSALKGYAETLEEFYAHAGSPIPQPATGSQPTGPMSHEGERGAAPLYPLDTVRRT